MKGKNLKSLFFLKAKKKKPNTSEKPAKKPKSGESSKPGGSSKSSSNGDDNMFQVGVTGLLCSCKLLFSPNGKGGMTVTAMLEELKRCYC